MVRTVPRAGSGKSVDIRFRLPSVGHKGEDVVWLCVVVCEQSLLSGLGVDMQSSARIVGLNTCH